MTAPKVEKCEGKKKEHARRESEHQEGKRQMNGEMKEDVQKEPQHGEDVETTARKKRGRIK